MLDRIADKLEQTAGSGLGIFAFIAWCALVPLWSVDTANYGIGVYTAFLLVIKIGPTRRDGLAVHVKLDDLECAIEQADSNNASIEHLTEAEILDRKAGIK
jgi:low affinity Fe/Cu permease